MQPDDRPVYVPVVDPRSVRWQVDARMLWRGAIAVVLVLRRLAQLALRDRDPAPGGRIRDRRRGLEAGAVRGGAGGRPAPAAV